MSYLLVEVNPLLCTAIGMPQDGTENDPAPGALLAYLFSPNAEGTPRAFARRYRELEGIVDLLFVAPAEETILRRLVWPLRHALGSYCLGDFLGCIATSGTVGEMVANAYWEIEPGPPGCLGTDDQGRPRTFERERQAERIKLLRKLDRIDKETADRFSDLRTIRNRHLHLFSEGSAGPQADARAALEHSGWLVAQLIDPSFPEPGRIAIRPALHDYVSRRSRSSRAAVPARLPLVSGRPVDTFRTRSSQPTGTQRDASSPTGLVKSASQRSVSSGPDFPKLRVAGSNPVSRSDAAPRGVAAHPG